MTAAAYVDLRTQANGVVAQLRWNIDALLRVTPQIRRAAVQSYVRTGVENVVKDLLDQVESP